MVLIQVFLQPFVQYLLHLDKTHFLKNHLYQLTNNIISGKIYPITDLLESFEKLEKRNKKINVNSFKNELYTKNIPDPEILIRTGGTKRLSNFLLWQLAYAEIFFVDKLWPDFKGDDFNKIVNKYYNIKRNFGKI